MSDAGVEIIMTNESNPFAMSICYAHGWSSSSNFMTRYEASKVKSLGSVTFGGSSSNHNTTLLSFDELQYFTGLTTIPNSFLNYTDNCTSVIIPYGVTSIGNGFYNATGLTRIVFPETLTTFTAYSFRYCSSLETVILPSSVTSIQGNVFRYCSMLSSVTVLATTPPSLGTFAFSNNKSGRKFYVPADVVQLYKEASGWSNFASSIYSIEE